MHLSRRDRHVQRLDVMTYRQKSEHWKRENPVGDGFGLSRSPKLSRHDVRTDGHGNILTIPKFSEKPCFGIPTAWLRHAHRKAIYVKRLHSHEHNSRCDRCLAADACKSVVVERIGAVAKQNSLFMGAFKAWEAAGGLRKGGFDTAYATLHHRGWSALTHPLSTATFVDANAEHVRQYWIKKRKSAAKVAAGKERHRLRQAWKKGAELSVLREGLTDGAKQRAIALHQKLTSIDKPEYLKRFPVNSITRLCKVWWSREFARFTGQDPNPNRIALTAIAEGRINGLSQTSLRQIVKRDLQRIKRLESNAQYNQGEAIWPKFSHPALL